jgi:hypothetical protein
MPLIPYPNVPNVPGVPNVLRKLPAGPPAILGSIAGIAQLVRAFTSAPVWGVFKHIEPLVPTPPSVDGLDEVIVTAVVKLKPVVTPDSIRDFGYSNEWSIMTAPTQNGAFADYNRVDNPFEVTLRMTKGGTERDRQNFLKQIEALDSTQLYDIITPEKTYRSMSLMRYEIHRDGEKGAFWLSEVDLTFREVRVVTAQYSRTSISLPINPSAVNPQNNGTQQAQLPVNPPSVAATVGAPGNIGR